MRNKTVFLVSALVIGAFMLIVTACSSANDDHTTSFSAVAGTPAPVPNSAAGDSSANAEPKAVPQGGGVGGGTTSGGTTSGAPSSGVGGASGSGVSNSLVDRKIERQATIEVAVDDVASTVAKIEAAAGAIGGFVSQSTITQSTEVRDASDKRDNRHATVQIRVPAEHYSDVMNQIRGFAKDITSENSSTQEVTGQYTDLQAQLRNLQATEGQYLKLLAQTASVQDILTVQDRLNSVQGQIEQVQGQINLIDNLSAMATITINVSPPALPAVAPEEPKPEPNWASEAWSNAWNASKDLGRYMGVAGITSAVVGAWLLVPGALAVVAWRMFGGGRRPAAPSP